MTQDQAIRMYQVLRHYPYEEGMLAREWILSPNGPKLDATNTALLWENLSRVLPAANLPRVRLAANDPQYHS